MDYKELDESLEVEIENSSQTFRIIWEQLLRNWYWFAVGLGIAWSLTYFQLRYAERFYSTEAKILIKEDVNQTGSELSVLAGKSLGRLDVKPNIADQIEVMSSRRLIGKVVGKLQLNVRYFVEGRIKRQEVYSEVSPIQLRVLSNDPSPISFDVNIKSASEIEIVRGDKITKTDFGKPFVLGNNELMVLPRKNKNVKEETNIQISVSSIESATNRYKGKINIRPSERSSVVSLSMVDNIPDRARWFINELVEQYNTDAINDKQLVGEKTTKFIEERLAKVADDLQARDQDVEIFIKENHVIDL